MNLITSFAHSNINYYEINREERNLAAIFYYLLLVEGNLDKFLKQINCKTSLVPGETGIYFEYAFIRDLWNAIGKDNEVKRNFILNFLNPTNKKELEKMPVFDFNKYFGAIPVSKNFIQSPGKWSIASFDKEIELTNDKFLEVCKFKWCFNAKPDIVIHISKKSAICIEAKLESKEGKYPANNIEKGIFNRRGLSNVGQLSIQESLMEDLLGIETKYIQLVQNKKIKSEKYKIFTWKEVLENLDTNQCPFFIKEWLKRV